MSICQTSGFHARQWSVVEPGFVNDRAEQRSAHERGVSDEWIRRFRRPFVDYWNEKLRDLSERRERGVEVLLRVFVYMFELMTEDSEERTVERALVSSLPALPIEPCRRASSALGLQERENGAVCVAKDDITTTRTLAFHNLSPKQRAFGASLRGQASVPLSAAARGSEGEVIA